MATTIQVSEKLLQELKIRKLYDKETYEEVIWDLIEDLKELKKEVIKELKEAEKEINEGKVLTHREIKGKLKI